MRGYYGHDSKRKEKKKPKPKDQTTLLQRQTTTTNADLGRSSAETETLGEGGVLTLSRKAGREPRRGLAEGAEGLPDTSEGV